MCLWLKWVYHELHWQANLHNKHILLNRAWAPDWYRKVTAKIPERFRKKDIRLRWYGVIRLPWCRRCFSLLLLLLWCLQFCNYIVVVQIEYMAARTHDDGDTVKTLIRWRCLTVSGITVRLKYGTNITVRQLGYARQTQRWGRRRCLERTDHHWIRPRGAFCIRGFRPKRGAAAHSPCQHLGRYGGWGEWANGCLMRCDGLPLYMCPQNYWLRHLHLSWYIGWVATESSTNETNLRRSVGPCHTPPGCLSHLSATKHTFEAHTRCAVYMHTTGPRCAVCKLAFGCI